jgi:transposase
VYVAWRCAQDLRGVYHEKNLAKAKPAAEKLVEAFVSCPIPEVARLGRTLRRWKEPFLAYFTTGGSSNGGAEAINGIIELHKRLARGFRNRDNYRLRMLLAAGGLDPRSG